MATQVWNGRKEDWRGCPAPLALVEGAWPLRVEFAKEDRVDNHYLVAGRLADLPARAVVIADDDVDLGNRAQSVSLLLKAWRASDDRIVGPSSSARGFAQPALALAAYRPCQWPMNACNGHTTPSSLHRQTHTRGKHWILQVRSESA